MTNTAPYIELDGLMRSYDGGQPAVADLHLSIRKGEFISFLGPSGSGKTTTLMMVAGFEQPDRGEIRLAAKALNNVPPYKRNIGIVFQNYALFPHMTVRRNVEFPLNMRDMERRKRNTLVDKALAQLGLSAFAERRPRELSGGQQQRVALARALVFEPDILLLDEPLGALDKNLREQMQVEIKRIQTELGITTIYVTHDQSEAMTLSDRIVVFKDGRVEQVDAPLEIYHRPKTKFVAGFVGDCNFLAARVLDPVAGKVRIDGIGDAELSHPIQAASGAELQLALRPEFIRIAVDGLPLPAGGFRSEIEVEGIVNYGSSVVILSTVQGRSFSIRALGRECQDIKVGQRIPVLLQSEEFWRLA